MINGSIPTISILPKFYNNISIRSRSIWIHHDIHYLYYYHYLHYYHHISYILHHILRYIHRINHILHHIHHYIHRYILYNIYPMILLHILLKIPQDRNLRREGYKIIYLYMIYINQRSPYYYRDLNK
jgi:hypothetical protein